MIDTIKFQFDLPLHQIEKIKENLRTNIIIENKTGAQTISITNGFLSGSWDSRIRITYSEDRPQYTTVGETVINIAGKKLVKSIKQTVNVPCSPYVTIEFSLPKWAYGVNFINKSIKDDLKQILSFKRWFHKQTGVSMPSISKWRLMRLDIAVCVFMIDEFLIETFFETMKNCEYTRRKRKRTNYNTGLYFPGTISTFKLYGKFEEFKKHDKPRFIKLLNKDIADKVHDLSAGLLRIEEEVRRKKLERMGVNTVADIVHIDWNQHLETETNKVLGDHKATAVTDFNEAMILLREYPYRGSGITCDSVMNVYSIVCASGKEKAKKLVGKDKFYRAMKIIKKTGISFNTNMTINELPEGLKSFSFEKAKRKMESINQEYENLVAKVFYHQKNQVM